MTFLSPFLLLWLGLIAIPVVLHLLNRGRAISITWGAMEFLRRSINLRTRRIRFEEALLLAMRCLALALPVLAMARPFLPSRGYVPAAALALFVIGAVCAGVAGALWSQRRLRRVLLAAAVALPVLGLLGAAAERLLQNRRWIFDGGERDWVVIVDGSSAMALPGADGGTLFDQAFAEARLLADALRPGDTLSAFIGAAIPIPLVPHPTSDRQAIAEAFAEVPDRKPPGGRFGVPEAMNAAINALGAGRHPSKTILVLGAGHRGGWSAGDDAQWKFLSNRMDAVLRQRPDVIYRRLAGATPGDIRNLAVGTPVLSRRLADTARPVRIEAEIVNAGTMPQAPGRVTLQINGKQTDERTIAGEIQPGAAETVSFSHRFEAAGPHVVAIALDTGDAITGDNQAVRVVNVLDRLPVLVIDGAPATRRRRSASSVLTAAMAPPEDREESVLRRIFAFRREGQAAGSADTGTDPLPATNIVNFVRPDVRMATDVADIGELARYRAVILLNVPSLPSAFLSRLAEYVRDGHGLWVIPGHLSAPATFDQWRSAAGEPLLPAMPAERSILKSEPTGPQLPSFLHPALQLLATDPYSDADALLVHAYWRLAPDLDDPNIRIAGLLRNGDPFMVERSFGQGLVVMSALTVDGDDSNLSSLKAFVPLVHETLYHLVGSAVPDDNTRAGSVFTAVLPTDPIAKPSPALMAAGAVASSATTPSGRKTDISVIANGDGLAVSLADTVESGLYELLIPADLASRVVSNRINAAVMPVAVPSDPRASAIELLTDADAHWMNSHVKLNLVDRTDDLAMILSEEVPGRALWSWFLLATLAVLVGEVAVSRYILRNRQNRVEAPVVFDAGVSENTSFESKVQQWFPNRLQ
jgi:hypothetical protein